MLCTSVVWPQQQLLLLVTYHLGMLEESHLLILSYMMQQQHLLLDFMLMEYMWDDSYARTSLKRKRNSMIMSSSERSRVRSRLV